MNYGIQKIAIEKLNVVQNSRDSIGDVSGLMDSIKRDGLMNPITVSVQVNGVSNVVIAGHRRLSACKKLGLAEVECNVVGAKSEKDAMILNLSENLQRKNTLPFEEGRFFNSLIEKYKMTKKELAVRMGVSTGYIGEAVNLFKSIPENYKEKVQYKRQDKHGDQSVMPMTSASKIMAICDEMGVSKAERGKVIDQCIDSGLKGAQLRLFVSLRKQNPKLTLNKFIKDVEHITVVRANIPVYKNEIKDCMDEWGCGKHDVVLDAVYGEIEPFVKPFQG